MSKGKILVVSRTPWSESPRIRHQISRLIRDIGYEVFYVEVLFKKIPPSIVSEMGIHIFRIYEKIHHQLKPFKFIKDLNSFWLKQDLAEVLYEKDFKVIFNFNYDNDFTFSLYKGLPTVTIINDDFYSMAKPWMKSQVLQSLSSTVRSSAYNLSVSYSLDRQIRQFTENADLFLPWAENEFTHPKGGQKREVVLYYGFISRLDLKIVEGLVEKGIRLRFIGPIDGNGKQVKIMFGKFSNVEILDPMPLNEVSMDDVCCSIAFYDTNLEFVKALTASNRLFQLLSFGIPFIYPNLPNLIDAPDTVIRKCASLDEYIAAIEYFKSNFYLVQGSIENFLDDHTKNNRKDFLSKLIESSTNRL